MLAVCLHKLCTHDSFEYLTFRLELCGNCSPEGGKSHRGAPKTAFSKPPEGSWTPGGPHLAANVARKLTLGGSGGALGALLAALGDVLTPLELLGRPGPLLGASWGSFWDLPGAVLDVVDDFCGTT